MAPPVRGKLLYARIGERIASARIAAGLTQQDLADAIGLSRPAVTNMETCGQAIMLDRLDDIASICGVTLVSLVEPFDRGRKSRRSPPGCTVCAIERKRRSIVETKLARIAAMVHARPIARKR